LTVVAAAALICAWISLPTPAFLAVAAGISLAWGWYIAQALQRGPAGLRMLELHATGGARCQDAMGQWHEAEVLPGSYVSGWLMVVILGASGARRRSLVLLPDSAAAGELRRLRVWLRWRLART
jgi:toxin CptA